MKVKSESEVAQSCPTLSDHGLQSTRLLRPWDPPGKSTGVGCHWEMLRWWLSVRKLKSCYFLMEKSLDNGKN